MGNGKAKSRSYMRRDERFATHGLSSPLGTITDLSASGMCIQSTGKPIVRKGDVETFELKSGRQKLVVPGVIVRLKRMGFRSKTFEIGVRFADARPHVRQALEELAKYGYVKGKTKASSSVEGAAQVEPLKAAIEVEDLYEVLEIDRDATGDEIRRAYRAMAKRYHPDVSDDEHASERFAVISKAYRVLGDDSMRERYDEMLLASIAA